MTGVGGIVQFVGWRITVIAFLAVLMFPTPDAQAQSCKRNDCLTKAEQCGKADVRVQTDSSKLSNQSALALATTCFDQARNQSVTTTPIVAGLSAYNSARLFDELARRSGSADDRMAHLARAAEAAVLSREKLADNATGFESGSGKTGMQNARVKRERLGILVKSFLERGLAPGAAATCGGEMACLTAGLNSFDVSVLNPSVEAADANVRTAFSELQILRGRASARRNALAPDNGDFERAIEYLKAAVSQENGSSSDASKSIVSRAGGLVVELASAEADRILSAPKPTADSISRAIRHLEDADTMMSSPALSAQRPKVKLARGSALMKRAELRPASEAAAKVADLCAATRLFDEGLSAGSAALPADIVIGLYEGSGLSLVRLAVDPQVQCGGLSKAGLEAKALAALDEAWRLRKANANAPNLSVLSDHIALLLSRGRDPGADMLAALENDKTEAAMRVQLVLARSAAAARPVTSEAQARAEEHFRLAVAASPESPEPELERGKFLYALALAGAADGDALRSRAEQDFEKAIKDADADSGKYAKERAEAYYYRSMNETLRSAAALADRKSLEWAVQWASTAFYANSANAEYGFQACRATLMARGKELGNAAQFCSVNASTSEGALLRAFMLFRDSQIKRKASRATTSSVFRQAEDAFGHAKEIWISEKAAGKTTRVNWPAGGGAYDPGHVADYGKWLSRQCTLDMSSSDPVPAGTDQTMPLFGRYGVFYCDRFDEPPKQ